MRTVLFVSTMLLVVAAPHCPAQSHAAAAAAATSDAAQSPPTQAMPGASGPKSAFGRVMAVLIAKLVQDRTQATQIPIDIEVGAAFRTDAAGPTVAAAEGTTARRGAGEATTQEPEPLALQAALPADGP